MRQKAYFHPRSERFLKKICLENRFATTKVIKLQLQDINANASKRTVRRKLKDLNFKTCLHARKPKLNPAMKAKRLNWAKQWRDKDVDFWRSVWFSEERTFEILQNKAHFVRRRRGEKFHSDCVVRTVKHPTKIMTWSVINGKGTGRLYVVKGMMRQDQYKDILKNRFIPLLEEWFPNGEPYIFMQDGAPCHTARSIKVFLAEQNISLLDWPGNSSDMSPIDNVWELMKREVAKDVITNKT
ncbi:transposable element Tcb2 transposase [Trichonephila clavipes]|nr:transposable element Tcb2 transposase [Trichonephila clavipes]